MPRAEFSVYQFFKDGSCERVREYVGPEAAVEAARHYCTSVAAKTGIVRRVIITNGGDETVFEWKFGKGLTWPLEKRDGFPPDEDSYRG